MNKIIKDVLDERAEQTEAPYVDAAQLIRRGRRRRYAKRGVGTLAVAAATAAAVALSPNVVDRLSDDGAVAQNPAPGLNLAWADADYIYFGEHRTPRPRGYFDLTTVGDRVIYTSSEGDTDDVYEWRPSEGGEPEPIVDDAIGATVEGNLAAWFTADGPDRLRLHFAVGDTEYSSLTLPTTRNDGPYIELIAGGPSPTVIYYTSRHLWSWNGIDDPTQLAVNENKFIDRTNDVSVVEGAFSDDYMTSTVHFRDAEGDEISRVSGVWSGGLLNDAADRYLTQSGDHPGGPVVVDVATGEATPLDIGRANRGLQMTWDLDGNVTIAVSPKGDDAAPVDLVSCDPGSGECTVLAEDVDKFGKVILAGETYAGL